MEPASRQTLVSAEDGEQIAKKKPPFPVILVAIFQFLKAPFILLLAHKVFGFVAALKPEGAATFGEILLYGSMALLAGGALYYGLLGFRLLRLEKEARRTLMWNILGGWLLFGVSFNGLFFGQGPLIEEWPKRTFLFVLVIDLFLYCCLAYYPDVAKAFGEKDDADIFS